MEAIIKLDELRKKASALKIKNYKKYSKQELLVLVEEERKKLYLPVIIVKFSCFKKKKKSREARTAPKAGIASMEIFKTILKHRDHKKWTLYKIAKIGGYSYTNVRRVYKKYIENKTEEEIQSKINEFLND